MSQGPGGCRVEAQVPTDRLVVVTDGDGDFAPDTEAEFASRLEGESAVRRR